jgi:hypothetical protein
MLLFLIVLAAGMAVGYLMWKVTSRQPPGPAPRRVPPRPSAPDDDPDFLRKLDERLRSEGEDGPARR